MLDVYISTLRSSFSYRVNMTVDIKLLKTIQYLLVSRLQHSSRLKIRKLAALALIHSFSRQLSLSFICCPNRKLQPIPSPLPSPKFWQHSRELVDPTQSIRDHFLLPICSLNLFPPPKPILHPGMNPTASSFLYSMASPSITLT